jgi:hypothetical protein
MPGALIKRLRASYTDGEAFPHAGARRPWPDQKASFPSLDRLAHRQSTCGRARCCYSAYSRSRRLKCFSPSTTT